MIARLKTLRPTTPELREKLDALIRYYTDNAPRMHYDEYLRLGYGIGSGAVESAHKQVVHARLRQAGTRWSDRGRESRISRSPSLRTGQAILPHPALQSAVLPPRGLTGQGVGLS